MPIVTRTGTYLATPVSWGIRQDEGKCPRFAMVFAANQYRVGAGWEDVEADEKITGFFTLFNKDGSPNEINLKALHDALGWDGQSLASLEGGDWSGNQVQIVVGEHSYNGKTSLEVKYLNPRDYQYSGIDKAAPETLQGLDMKYGASLRALFAKPSGNGAKPGTLKVVAPPSGADAAKQEAWKAFTQKTPKYDPQKRAETFKRIVGEMLPAGKEPKDCDAADWTKIRDAIDSDFMPDTGMLVPI